MKISIHIYYIYLSIDTNIYSPEYGQLLVDGDDGLDEVVVVDAAHEVREEGPPDLGLEAGEEELQQVRDAAAGVRPRQVLEHQRGAEVAGLQLSPDNQNIYD